MELNKAVEKFLEACDKELKLSEKTNRAYAYDLGQFSDFMQNKPLEKIVSSDINKYLSYLDDEQKRKD